MGYSGIRAAYATGRGKIVLRGRAEIEETRSGYYRIVTTEIPYKVNKQELVKSFINLMKDKKVEGIDDVVDYSGQDGMKIVVDLKRDANPQVVLNQLYSYTQLQVTFGAILLALDKGRPKIMTLKEMLQSYIDFRVRSSPAERRLTLKRRENAPTFWRRSKPPLTLSTRSSA